MVYEISISNYKSILRQQFPLGRLNVFVGRNGSGKTNILEAIGLASAAHDEALDSENLKKRGIKPTKPSLMIHSSPNQEKNNNEIEIVWHEKNSWKKSKLVCNDINDINASWKDVSWYEPEYVEKINNLILYISDGTIKGQYPFSDQSKNAALNAAFRGSRNFRNYHIYNYFDVLKESPESYYLSLFSDTRAPSIFAIDNIESLLAPDICGNLIQTIAKLTVKQNKQVFITTNNPDVVKGMDLKILGQKLFVVKITEGKTVVEELKDISLVEI